MRGAPEAGAPRDIPLLANGEQKQRILDVASQSRASARAGDAEGLRGCHAALHNLIAEVPANKLLSKAVSHGLVMSFTLRSRDVLTKDDSVYCGEEHVAYAKIIFGGNTSEASKLIQAHIMVSLRLVPNTGLRACLKTLIEQELGLVARILVLLT